jgi:hypothetical protein
VLVISEYFMFNVWKILARVYCMHVFLVRVYSSLFVILFDCFINNIFAVNLVIQL